MTDTTDDPSRRGRLIGLKLRALVRDHLGDDSLTDASEFAPGAALLHGDTAWTLLDSSPARRLGAALAWALRSGASSLQVIAEDGTGTLTRRASEFAMPVTVWRADGRSLLPAVAEPLEPSRAVPTHHEQFRALIIAGGAEPLVEHGVLFGEVRGLEVCRVVDDPHLGSTRLEVGVGAHDREAFQMMHGDVPAAESLSRISAIVAGHREVGMPQHPLNRLAAERFIRWRIEQDPSLIGAVSAAHAPPPVPRSNLKDPEPCVAHGVDADGRMVIVVCAVGVDLDVVPYAADARLAAEAAAPGVGRGGRLVIAMPSRDRVRVTAELGDRLAHPVDVASID